MNILREVIRSPSLWVTIGREDVDDAKARLFMLGCYYRKKSDWSSAEGADVYHDQWGTVMYESGKGGYWRVYSRDVERLLGVDYESS